MVKSRDRHKHRCSDKSQKAHSHRKKSIGRNVFRRADALGSRGMKSLDRSCADMVLCDPPYGVTARNKWDTRLDIDALFDCIDHIAKPDAAVIFFSQGMLTAELMTGPWTRYWRYNLVWKKNKPRGFLNSKRMPLRYHEDIVIFYRTLPTYNPQMIETGRPVHACTRKETSKNYGLSQGGENLRAGRTTRYPGSVLEFSVLNANDPERVHETQKPVNLCEFLIRSFTDEEGLVVDPCAGSGTTAVAARNCGRRYVCFEKDREIFLSAKMRLKKHRKHSK